MAATAHDLNRERHWTCARRICERRHALGLTQNDVVDRLDGLGVTATNRTLSAMEHGQGVDVGRLPELATALDCSVTYLLGLTDDPDRWAPDDLGVRLAVDVTDRLNPARQAQPSGGPNGSAGWILGPDVPDRPKPASAGPRA
jgi:transcriptional regulator with XRE-family HTH domain